MTGAAKTVILHLVRHGETTTYGADAGLTALGRQQAAARGRALAAQIPAESLLGVVHAPTERARETAQVLLDAYLDDLPQGTAPRLSDPVPAPEFRNLQVYVGPDGRSMEPTAARALLTATDRGDEPDEGWMIEARRFWAVHERSGDTMGFWLTTPLLWHESPAQVVGRLVRAMLACRDSADRDGHLVVAGHSGCLRALVAWASGVDHGEPDNAAEVVITIPAAGDRIVVGYQAGTWAMPVPADTR